MKKIYKFLFPLPSLCIWLLFTIMFCLSEESCTVTDIIAWIITVFIMFVLPIDIIYWIWRKFFKKDKPKLNHFVDAQYNIIQSNEKSLTYSPLKNSAETENVRKNYTVDSYFKDSGFLVISNKKATIGMIQRHFQIGFNRACRIMDQLCDTGVVGQEEGTRPRKILMNTDDFQTFIENNDFNYKDSTSIEEQTKLSENNSKTIIPERIHMYNNKFDYMTGHDFEYFCADLLQKNGFQDITVTQGSGDHGVDILAEKTGVSYAIQCKCYSKDIGNAAIQQVHAGKSIYKRDIAVVLTNRFFTPQAKEEAAILGVKLWDRDILIKLINSPL